MSEEQENRDPIENFFERKAREYDISYQEADWLKLEKRLDRQERHLLMRRIVGWSAAAAVLLMALLGYFIYQNYNQISELNRLLEANRLQPNESLVTPDLRPVDPPHDDLAQQRPDSPGQNEERVAGDSPDAITGRGDLFTSSQGVEKRAEVLYAADLSCSNCGLSGEYRMKNYQLKEKKARLSIVPDHFLQEPVTRRTDRPRNGAPADAKSSISSTGSTALSRLSLGLVAGPDLSTAGSISEFYDPGHSLGFMAEYAVSKRFSLRAGLQRSQLRYTAGSNDYHPPEGYWTRGIAADRTTAECLLLDIPISLKYEALQFRASSFYVTGGLSSYIMLSETYRFDYNYSNGQGELIQQWSEKTGSRHWMSNATVSVGYELEVHQNWSIRAEPYLKVPLKGVGWGDVDLYSAGSMIALNYRFSPR